MRGFSIAMGVLAACGGAPTTDATDTDVTVDLSDVTWFGQVKAVVDGNCLPCHESGGVGPIPLDVGAEAFAGDTAPVWAATATASVAAGSMPPWHASEDCHPIAEARTLNANERALFAAWAEQGHRMGDVGDYVPGERGTGPELGTADRVLAPTSAYTPTTLRPDDYHCLPLGDAFDEDAYVEALEVVPGQLSIVHHALVFAVDPALADTVVDLDEATPGPGYPCFGGVVPGEDLFSSNNARNIATWVPGGLPERLRDGDARFVAEGSRIVMQVHYNTLNVGDDGPPADATSVALWLRDTPPDALIETVALVQSDFLIDAGDPDGVATKDFAFGLAADIVALQGHMHQLGSALSVTTSGTTEGERCGLDIPAWDFDWQQVYAFPDDTPFELARDDTVTLTCRYDNSAANQPVVNGEQQSPRDVRWGEGTLDEMCLAYAHVRVPFVPGEDAGCGPVESCFASCPEGDGDCLTSCLARSINSCGVCTLQGLGACAAEACGLRYAALAQCLDGCGDEKLACLAADCRDKTAAYLTCLDPHVRDGTCDPYLDDCGLQLGP